MGIDRRVLLVLLASGMAAAAADTPPPPPPASAFAALPEMSLVSLSPDGRRVAWANDPGGTPLVVVLDLETGRDIKRLRPSNARIRNLDWADDRTLVMSVSRSLTSRGTTIAERRYEFQRFLALDVEAEGGEARSLLMEHPSRELVTSASIERLHPANAGTVVMSTYSFSESARRQEIGSRLSGGRRDEGYELSLFEVDLRNGAGRLIESGTPYTDDWVLDPEGRAVARSDWNPETRHLTVFAKRDGSWRPIYSARLDYEFRLLGLTADRSSVLVRSSLGADRIRLWAIPLAGGEPVLHYEHPEHDVLALVQDRFSGAPVGYQLGGPDADTIWTDPRMESIERAIGKAFAGKDAIVFDRSRDYQRIVARVESPSSPPVYYLVDFGKGSADIIGEAYPALAGAALGSVEFTSYRASDGTAIPAYLTLPPGREARNLPLVVFPHGGPYARDLAEFDWWTQFLATRGYAVLQPQFRGSWGFGAALYRAGHRQWGRGMQEDISDGVRFLVGQGIADPKRVCIVGASYGGYAALAGAAFTPDLYACAASINGISDIPQHGGYIRERSGDDSDAWRGFLDLIGNPSEDSITRFSPARSVDTIRVPILLVHANRDSVVLPSQSENFARLLKQSGKPHEYLVLDGEDHWLSTGAARLALLEGLERFLQANLR